MSLNMYIYNYNIREQQRQDNVKRFKDHNLKFDSSPFRGAWCGYYKGVRFRSMLEVSYIINTFEAKPVVLWTTGESMEDGIPYFNKDGKYTTYWVDFLSLTDCEFIECKSTDQLDDEDVKFKAVAARKYCKDMGFSYRLMAPASLPVIKQVELYVDGLIKFIPSSEEVFEKKNKLKINYYKKATK